ncbi:hypothetical protein CEP54_012078 [Fusarium duplospermum]|uniref:N-acetyltransferase domain-containing protein n=1 Tax=Fusarium duplospermum TaxID=1325734 RepID=A0A428PAZ5_9HYPO|nr:hypothetical protein CEP54_012078 [Fusarium duplospermum]
MADNEAGSVSGGEFRQRCMGSIAKLLGPGVSIGPGTVGRVGLQSFRYSPVFDWEHPKHAKFPQDILLSYRQEFSSIKSLERIVLVATDKVDPNEGEKTSAIIPLDNSWVAPKPDDGDEVVVGVTYWKLQPGSDRKGCSQNDDAPYPEFSENPKRDMDNNHCDALDECCEAAEEDHARYFQGLASMEMIVVHPAYWRRGHGSRLARWGIDLAKIDGVSQGVIAAKMGKALYLSLSYKNLTDLHLEGDEVVPQGVGISAMQYHVNSSSAVKQRLLPKGTRLRPHILKSASAVKASLGQVFQVVRSTAIRIRRDFLCVYGTGKSVEKNKDYVLDHQDKGKAWDKSTLSIDRDAISMSEMHSSASTLMKIEATRKADKGGD